ncbi:hypothetical protein L1987_22500 [Smallanthus sonchifolius]|uniref:Uncharacterized protein n=1 Tax=Smallanthus sonchifolius TaxID=185202 RepID=A0ACB9IGI6_9ASTR|nr:hypothetical protein L1987_22500 [Smallanthus sonchifolius]
MRSQITHTLSPLYKGLMMMANALSVIDHCGFKSSNQVATSKKVRDYTCQVFGDYNERVSTTVSQIRSFKFATNVEDALNEEATTSLGRLAYFGMSSNLLLYFRVELNQHSATTSRNLSNWTATSQHWNEHFLLMAILENIGL